MVLCLRSPASNRLILWSIFFWLCVCPLSCFANLATSVLPATDITSGKYSPTQEDRLYLAEFFSYLGKQTCLCRWVSRAFQDGFHRLLSNSLCTEATENKLKEIQPHDLPTLYTYPGHMLFLFQKPFVSARLPDLITNPLQTEAQNSHKKAVTIMSDKFHNRLRKQKVVCLLM